MSTDLERINGVFTSQGRQSEAHAENIEGELLYHCNCWFLKWKDTLKYYFLVIYSLIAKSFILEIYF